MLSKYFGDYFFTGCFCYGKIENGEFRAFDSLEDYEAYRDSVEVK